MQFLPTFPEITKISNFWWIYGDIASWRESLDLTLIWVGYFKDSFCRKGRVGEVKLVRVKIMVEIWNLEHKYTHYLVSENVPFSTRISLILLAFFCKKISISIFFLQK